MPVLLSVGRLVSQKDYPTLLKAFKLLSEKIECRLIILSEGPERDKISDLISRFSLTDKVDLARFYNNPYAFMSKADLFVFSSKYESLGNVVIESLACGTPVVSTNCAYGPEEILESGKYDNLVPVEDAQILSDAMFTSLQTSHDAQMLIERAHLFSLDAPVNKYISLFQRISRAR